MTRLLLDLLTSFDVIPRLTPEYSGGKKKRASLELSVIGTSSLILDTLQGTHYTSDSPPTPLTGQDYKHVLLSIGLSRYSSTPVEPPNGRPRRDHFPGNTTTSPLPCSHRSVFLLSPRVDTPLVLNPSHLKTFVYVPHTTRPSVSPPAETPHTLHLRLDILY